MFDYYLHLHFRSRWRLWNGCWWSEMPLGALNFRRVWYVPQRLLTLVCRQEMLCAQLLSHVQLFVTLWTVTCQAPLSVRFPRQDYWSGLPFPSPADLPDPNIEPMSPALQTASLPLTPPGKTIIRKYWSWQSKLMVTFHLWPNLEQCGLMERETNQEYDHWAVIPGLSATNCVTVVGYLTSLGLISSGEAKQL